MNKLSVFAYPFRIFFLSMAVWAVAVVVLWVINITGLVHIQFALPGMLWHQHEILFAILNPAIAGFLLTAVCNWTGTERIHGTPLMLMWLVWLLARLAGISPMAPEWLVIGLNLLFLPLVILDAGHRILAKKQWRQAPILLVLTILWLAEGALLLQLGIFSVQVALVAASALMLIVGGRITPAFSGGWLRGRGQDASFIYSPVWLERLTLGAMLTLCVVLTLGIASLSAFVATVAGLISLARILLWRGWRFWQEPLLWILHLSLLWIPVGLLLLAGGRMGWWAENVWVHAIGIGAMGALIFSVICRVSLNHTGRPIILPAGMVSAFVMLHAAAVIRVLTTLQHVPWQRGIEISAVLWCLAWLLFLVHYNAILMQPQADGRPG